MKKSLLIYLLILVFVPVSVVNTLYDMLLNYESNNKSKEKEIEYKIKINKNNNIIELNLEDYIIGVVAGEMPASFNIEALKAQSVASRTYAMYQYQKSNNLNTTTSDQVYITKEEMETKWGNDFNKYYNKIKEAVQSTKNLVMKKDNKIFKSFYFSMSNGYTADSITVFKENSSISVASPWDNETLNKFIVTTEFNIEELKENLNIKELKNIEIISRDNTNRVENIKVNDKIYTGIEFRKLLNLRSTDFSIEQEENRYKITTKGYGHGVGMSQYGANGMAKENYNYQEILKYYYQNIEITTI